MPVPPLKPCKLPGMDSRYCGYLASDADVDRASANPTAPTESTSGTATQQTSEATAQSTSGATVAAAPALAVIAGLGVQLININL